MSEVDSEDVEEHFDQAVELGMFPKDQRIGNALTHNFSALKSKIIVNQPSKP